MGWRGRDTSEGLTHTLTHSHSHSPPHLLTHSRTHWHLLVHRHQFDRGYASDAGVAHNGHQGQGHARAQGRGTRGQVLLHVGVERAERRLVGNVDQDLGVKCVEELASWRAAPTWGGGRAAVAVRETGNSCHPDQDRHQGVDALGLE